MQDLLSGAAWPRVTRVIAQAACAGSLILASGCGASTKPVVGLVTVTDAKGTALSAISSVKHGGSAVYFDAVVTNDFATLGVDWTVTCSSSLPTGTLPAGTVDTSCGTFAPSHTASGPVPTYVLPAGVNIVTLYTPPANVPKAGTVTIEAHSTTDPSQVSILVLTVT